MEKFVTVARTNNPWENLHILRKLKKKYKAKYTPGLINTDTKGYYQIRYGDIYCVGEDCVKEGIKTDFDYDKYFKGHHNTITEDTFHYGLIETKHGIKKARCGLYCKTKQELIDNIKEIFDDAIERFKDDIKLCEDHYKDFLRDIEEL